MCAVLLWAGARNGVDLATARSFLHVLRPPTSGRLQVLPGGRHLTTDFARMMPASFAFLSAALGKPSAAA